MVLLVEVILSLLQGRTSLQTLPITLSLLMVKNVLLNQQLRLKYNVLLLQEPAHMKPILPCQFSLMVKVMLPHKNVSSGTLVFGPMTIPGVVSLHQSKVRVLLYLRELTCW